MRRPRSRPRCAPWSFLSLLQALCSPLALPSPSLCSPLALLHPLPLLQATLSYLALKGLQAMQACISRPVARRPMLAGLSLAAVVPRGGLAQEALIALFR